MSIEHDEDFQAIDGFATAGTATDHAGHREALEESDISDLDINALIGTDDELWEKIYEADMRKKAELELAFGQGAVAFTEDGPDRSSPWTDWIYGSSLFLAYRRWRRRRSHRHDSDYVFAQRNHFRTKSRKKTLPRPVLYGAVLLGCCLMTWLVARL